MFLYRGIVAGRVTRGVFLFPRVENVLNILLFCPCERGFILGRPPSLIPIGNCIGEVDTLLLGCCLGCGCPSGTR